MEVVEDHEQSAGGGSRLQHARHSGEEEESFPRVVRVGRIRRGRREHVGRDPGHDFQGGFEVRSRLAERLPGHSREHLAPGPVRGCTLGLDPRAPRDGHAVGRGSRGRGCRERRLADAGFAGQEDQAARVAERRVEPAFEHLQLVVPADKNAAEPGQGFFHRLPGAPGQ